MILEVGAGGCIMVTRPTKGSVLEKAMSGEKIGDFTIDSLLRSEPVSFSESFNKAVQEEVMGLTLSPTTEAHGLKESKSKETVIEHACYDQDIYQRDEDGTILTDVNGNALYLHRKGDFMLNALGEPMLKEPTRYNSSAPRVLFNGIRDGNWNSCTQQHIGEIRQMDWVEFNRLFEEVNAEAKRRLEGGQPIDIGDDQATVCSL